MSKQLHLLTEQQQKNQRKKDRTRKTEIEIQIKTWFIRHFVVVLRNSWKATTKIRENKTQKNATCLWVKFELGEIHFKVVDYDEDDIVRDACVPFNITPRVQITFGEKYK